VYNRGQRGLAIDLSSPAAREAFYALVRTVDVVLDNARLGVLHRLKIDYASLREVKPDIVTLSVNGFGEAGPLAAKPGFDPVLQAMSGMMSAQGGDSDPVLFTIPINDIAAGVSSVLGTWLGMLHRERTGVGQRLWTSLLGCFAMMQYAALVRVEPLPPAGWRVFDFKGPSALDRFYKTSDGWLRVHAPEVSALRVAGILDPSSSWKSDAELAAALSGALATRTVADVVACLTAAGIPTVAARMPGDLTDDPHLTDLEMFTTLHMRDGTPFFVAHRYARFSRTQEQAVLTPPGVGEHSCEILSEAGVCADDVEKLMAAGLVRQGEPFQVVAIQNYR